jgi:hypothetical protein
MTATPAARDHSFTPSLVHGLSDRGLLFRAPRCVGPGPQSLGPCDISHIHAKIAPIFLIASNFLVFIFSLQRCFKSQKSTGLQYRSTTSTVSPVSPNRR